MCLVPFLKFGLSIAFYATFLQALELFPTCLRQTGGSLAGVLGNAFGAIGPYIVHLVSELTITADYFCLKFYCQVENRVYLQKITSMRNHMLILPMGDYLKASHLCLFQGTTFDNRCPFAIIGVICVFAATTGLFLPETLYQKSPETLAEAEEFGKGQKIWSLPHKPKPEPEYVLK